MGEIIGWVGFWLLLGTTVPLILRRKNFNQAKTENLIQYHHNFALASLVVLTFHGLLALTGGRGWRHGFWLNHIDGIVYGIITWSLLLAICLIALTATWKRISSRRHCWLVGLLVLFVLLHVF